MRPDLVIAESLHPLNGDIRDYGALIDKAADARFVLLGESTHGTHQFYRDRALITQQLIQRGFDAVAVEADWPDASRVRAFVVGAPEDAEAIDALGGFKRFPTWMWRNADVLDLVGWLREYDERHRRSVGFFGLDLYSLHRSMDAVVQWFATHRPDQVSHVREHYACFERFGDDPQRYGRAAAFGLGQCADDVVHMLTDVARNRPVSPDEVFFDAEVNARIAVAAEAYYRRMFSGQAETWNLRDTHMADTLDRIAHEIERRNGRPARIVVWAHNSHIGDARATAAAKRREINLGQLVRERHRAESLLVGFTTYTGTVTAASDWGGAAERKRIRPALAGSWEDLFHQVGRPRWWLDLHDPRVAAALDGERLERFIGVLYLPESERWSHWYECRIAEQYDALVYYETTRAVEPLERTSIWDRGELPDTFPWQV
jgi:erythromycin esterase-like protein